MMKLISEELLDSVSQEARESSRLRMSYRAMHQYNKSFDNEDKK